MTKIICVDGVEDEVCSVGKRALRIGETVYAQRTIWQSTTKTRRYIYPNIGEFEHPTEYMYYKGEWIEVVRGYRNYLPIEEYLQKLRHSRDSFLPIII